LTKYREHFHPGSFYTFVSYFTISPSFHLTISSCFVFLLNLPHAMVGIKQFSLRFLPSLRLSLQSSQLFCETPPTTRQFFGLHCCAPQILDRRRPAAFRFFLGLLFGSLDFWMFWTSHCSIFFRCPTLPISSLESGRGMLHAQLTKLLPKVFISPSRFGQ